MYFQYWVPGCICTVAVALLLSVVCLKFFSRMTAINKKLGWINGELQRRLDENEDIAKCDMNNLDKLDGIIADNATEPTIDAWKRFSFDIKKMFGTRVSPEPDGYFTYDDIFSMPANAHLVKLAFKLVPAIGLISVLTSPTILALSMGNTSVLETRICISAVFISLIIIVSLFTLFYTTVNSKIILAQRTLFTFNRMLTVLLPTANSSTQAGLLLEASSLNTDVFREMTTKLVGKIDDFAINGIAPMISTSFDASIETHISPTFVQMGITLDKLSTKVLERQEDGMRVLAESFSQNLSDSLITNISSLADCVSEVTSRMENVRLSVEIMISDMTERTVEDRNTLRETIEVAQNVLSAQKEVATSLSGVSEFVGRTEQILVDLKNRDETVFENLESCNNNIIEIQGQLKSQIDSYEEQKQMTFDTLIHFTDEIKEATTASIGSASKLLEEGFAKYADELLESLRASVSESEKTFARLADISKYMNDASISQYEKAAEAQGKLLNNIISSIEKSIGGIGDDIYNSMSRATSDTSAIVDRLAATAEQIKTEYDFYFTRMESENTNIVNEMDFHMQQIFSRFSEEAGNVMGKLEANIEKSMGMFEGSTATLLAGISDEARSIGLYAKDLTIDVAGLSENLQGSVKIFVEHLNDSTKKTFEQFDNGLADINLRFANTIESVRESVENLPKALKR